jgi:hypothetical protein
LVCQEEKWAAFHRPRWFEPDKTILNIDYDQMDSVVMFLLLRYTISNKIFDVFVQTLP